MGDKIRGKPGRPKGSKNSKGRHDPTRIKGPPPPENRYPEDHPLWTHFLKFIEDYDIIAIDILNRPYDHSSGNDWKIMWMTFLAGYDVSIRATNG